jgi:hypothetical protein
MYLKLEPKEEYQVFNLSIVAFIGHIIFLGQWSLGGYDY